MSTRRPGFPARINTGAPAPAPAPRPAGWVGRGSSGLGMATQSPLQAASMTRDPFPARARMVRQLAADGISSPEVLRAMGSVPRHHFIDSALASQAYEDTALPIGLGQTISKPSVVARMLDLLMQGGLRGPDGRLGRVLDIGTGCGYQAVVLAELASEVYSIERLRALHEKARHNLRPLRALRVHLILGDGRAGFAAGAPYAGIVAAAGGEAVPLAWVDQLAVGGRIVAPVVTDRGHQALVVIDRTAQGLRQQVLEAVHFVPLKSGLA